MKTPAPFLQQPPKPVFSPSLSLPLWACRGICIISTGVFRCMRVNNEAGANAARACHCSLPPGAAKAGASAGQLISYSSAAPDRCSSTVPPRLRGGALSQTARQFMQTKNRCSEIRRHSAGGLAAIWTYLPVNPYDRLQLHAASLVFRLSPHSILH